MVTGDITRERDGPVAISSQLGWLLSGPTRDRISRISTNLALTESTSVDAEVEQDELTTQLQQFWNTESIGITESPTPEDDGFSKIITFDSSQHRYFVTLPWNSLHLRSTNYKACLTPLHYLRTRLQKNVPIVQEYQSTFNEQLKSVIIEVVSKSGDN